MKMFNKVLLVVALMLGLAGLAIAATTVDLGTANNFAVLAGSTITNTGSSVISGNLGLSPGSSVTGFLPGILNGTQHVSDGAALQAKNDLSTAYTSAGQPLTSTITADLGGQTLVPGVYKSGTSIGLTGKLTLDAGGDPNAVFIFQAGSTLTTAGYSEVSLINGAQSCHVFWQVGSSATLGTYSVFKGNILALTSITLTTGANVEGSVLAQNGAVTLDTNIVNKVECGVVPPAVTPVSAPAPANSSSSGWTAPPPLISITKIPSPLTLPSGPGPVTFTYAVTNIGAVVMSNIWVKDNKCSPVNFISGDTNGDSKLDKNETWIYNCTRTVSQTETNTATTHGWSNGWDGYATANATVVVGLPLIPPLIHIVKTPDVFVLPVGGGAVTYTYKVTNPGTAPLSDVSVIDDKCTGLPGRVKGHPGDINKNDLLDPGEIWQFTCSSNISQTTTNLATAEGHANGLTAIAFASATVVVASPKLPSTGFPPYKTNIVWNIVASIGILATLFLFYINVKRRVN